MILFLSIISGLLYRAGGKGKPFHTTYRDAGCSAIALLTLYTSGVHGPWWAFVLSFGALWGALTTYHKWASKPFYKDDEVHAPSWFVTGLVYGLAFLFFFPYWKMILARALVLGIFTCIWSESMGDAFWEEFGRGFLLVVTVPIIIS
jgi:hypothetical protein